MPDYYGYSNYETFTVGNWIAGDDELYGQYEAAARKHKPEELALLIMQRTSSVLGALKADKFAVTLLLSMLHRVKYHEIAARFYSTN